MSGSDCIRDWTEIAQQLASDGHAVLPQLLTAHECNAVVRLYDSDDLYRSRIVMARHGFGSGEYKYFAYPLPDLVERLRTGLYPYLAPIANMWHRQMGLGVRFPADHQAFLARCHDAGQKRPTPLVLRYVEGDYNCLHQDLYGELIFPLQVAVLLARPGIDFTGGEFVMTQTDTTQQRAEVVPLQQGDGVVFAVRHRPAVAGPRVRRTAVRHGVCRINGGLRHTLGVIFHDAL